MTITVAEWGTYGGWHGKRDVASATEALDVCAEVESRSGAGRVLVGFTAPSGHFFAVGLGHERSCLMYWESVDPPYFQSRGIDEGEPLDFAYDGQHTEVLATSLISRDAALPGAGGVCRDGQTP
jgi:hypothetical protein